MYQNLKKNLTIKQKIPSQFIRKYSLLKQKNPMSVASKIAIQMSAKMGFIPWQINIDKKHLQNKAIVYGAISISKSIKGVHITLVGTVD